MPRLANHATNLPDDLARMLAVELRGVLSIDQAIAWGLQQSTPRAIVEVATHDDDAHDVVFEWQRGYFLVFDATCAGTVREVAVWDYRPDADDLLRMRQVAGFSSKAVNPAHPNCPVLGHSPS